MSLSEETVEPTRSIKKQRVVETVLKRCTSDSETEVLRKIWSAVQSGDELEALALTGGYTNYGYKVFLRQSPSTSVFAKVSYPSPLFNPSLSWPHERTDNEYAILKLCSSFTGSNTPKPLFCVDVDEAKILVLEWAAEDDLFWRQMVDGDVDPRVVTAIANSLNAIHSMPVQDKSFNNSHREKYHGIAGMIRDFLSASHSKGNPNRVEARVQQFGADFVTQLGEVSTKRYFSGQVYVHGDSHAFNTLVESRQIDGSFGPTGSITLCDWESSFIGAEGFDLGFQMAFPVACVLWHSIQRRKDKSDHLLSVFNLICHSYVEAAKTMSGKDDAFLRDTMRDAIGWCGLYLLFSLYLMKNCVDQLTYSDDNEGDAQRTKVMEGIGVIGIEMSRLGFLEYDDMSVEELQVATKTIITEELYFQTRQ